MSAAGDKAPLVLVVEDSATETHVLKQALAAGGFRAVAIPDGASAVAAAQRFAPVLILMDVVMPRMNGFQATRELKREPATAGIPVVFLSSKDGESDRAWGLRQGAVDYLVKPVASADLLASVRRHALRITDEVVG